MAGSSSILKVFLPLRPINGFLPKWAEYLDDKGAKYARCQCAIGLVRVMHLSVRVDSTHADPAAGRTGFSLVEMLIVISILGIMAAIVVPILQDHSQKAKEAAAKDNLRILRTAIELYAAHNGVPPGYPHDNPMNAPSLAAFGVQMFSEPAYLPTMPDNPINNKFSLAIHADSLPDNPTDDTGWTYCPHTRDIRLNSSGMDSEGTTYYEY